MKNQNKLLFYHPGALGDVILTFPALRALRTILTGGPFAGLGKAEVFRLAQQLGLLDEVLDQEDGRLSGFFAGQKMPPALQNLFAALLWVKDAEDMEEFLRPHTAGPIISFPPPSAVTIHRSLHYLRRIQKYFPINIPPNINQLLPDIQTTPELILIHPGSGSRNKIFPLELYTELEKLITGHYPQKIYYLLGPVELESSMAVQLSGKHILAPASPIELSDLLQRTALYIGNDSGPSHLAGFLQIPSIVLYRTTDPAVWGTLGGRSVHVTASDTEEAYRKIARILQSK
jgi:ADP-heptose:LPS heptosyltransferase